MNVTILILDHVFDTGLATVLDALTTANELAGEQRFRISIAGVRSPVTSAQGFSISVTPFADCPRAEWVIVPAIAYKMPGPLCEALCRPDIADAVMALRHWSAAGTRIAASCIGTFILAETGLLNGERATTTWWLAPLFRERYPKVCLQFDRMIVPSGSFLTAGAALSHIDMTLWLIRQSSWELADLVARYLIVDTRPSQSSYVISDHLAHSDPLVQRFDRWVREHLRSAINLDIAASDLATSKRTLARHVRDVLGKTPIEYIQDLRIERAVHLLRTGDDSVDAIANIVGYAEGATLRSLLRRRLGRGVREIKIKPTG